MKTKKIKPVFKKIDQTDLIDTIECQKNLIKELEILNQRSISLCYKILNEWKRSFWYSLAFVSTLFLLGLLMGLSLQL